MNIQHIPYTYLVISSLNVRKNLDVVNDDDSSVSDLAKDIQKRGLLNPLTVRQQSYNTYEVIAGQRRLLAINNIILHDSTFPKDVPCNVLVVDDDTAEEISMIENIQRNQMTAKDKVRIFAKLYKRYNNDIHKLFTVVNISVNTLKRYIQINELPEEILDKMDGNDDTRLTLNVAAALTKIPSNIVIIDFYDKISSLSNTQKVEAIKQFISEGHTDINEIQDIKENIVVQDNRIKLAPSTPYVIDEENMENPYVIIPRSLYKDVLALIRNVK